MAAKDLPAVLDAINMKNYPKCDLFWMISVLDKFDALLGSDASEDVKVSILKFTKQLMENSLNRSIYNSYEHLDQFLKSNSLILIRCSLDLLVRVAQRNHQQHGALSNFTKNLSLDTIKALVQFDYDSDTFHYYADQLVILQRQSLTMEQLEEVPADKKVSVFLWQQQKSELLLQIKLLAQALFVWMSPESQVVDQHWVIQQAKDQAEALVVVESLFSWRGRVSNLLGALQASASHGILLFQLKSIRTLPEKYVDALLSLITTVSQLKEGGSQLVQAGLMQQVVALLDQDLDIRVCTRLVSLLDQVAFTNNVPNSFENVVAADGFKVIVGRVHRQMKFCLQSTTVTETKPEDEPKSPNMAHESIPHEHVAFFKGLLRFMIHTMQSHGGNDRVRTLIDGPLVSVVREVIEKPQVFGAVLYAMSINLMGAFIHNDPTSYVVLQEKGVPQSFMKSLLKFPISPSFDLLFAIPNALGAVCLNSDGMKEVMDSNPFGKFFEVFLSADHLRAMLDEDVSSALGNSFDELTRHHPDLKPLVQKEILQLLDKLIGMAQVKGTEKQSGLYLESGDGGELKFVDEEAVQKFDQLLQPLPIMNFIESVSRFLMGYFTNEQHAKDLMTEDLVGRLVDLYIAPSLPHDFAASVASYSLSNVLRVTSSFMSQALLSIIITKLKLVYQENVGWIDCRDQSSVFVPFIENPSEEHQIAYRSFVKLHALLGLLCDVYSQPVFSQSNVVLKVLEGFTSKDNSQVLTALCQIYGACALEIQFFRQNVRKELLGTEVDKKFADPSDYRVLNVKYFKYLLTQSTAFIVPVLQGLSKMLLNKRMDAELYRLPAEEGAKLLVQAAISLLSNSRLPTEPGVVRFHYIQIAVGFCHTLCTDDRYVDHILTIVAAQFVKAGGLVAVLKLLEELAQFKSDDEEITKRAQAAVEIVLKLIKVLTDKKSVMESAHTTNLLAKDGQALRLGSKFDVLRPVFNPEEFLVANRVTVLDRLLPIMGAKHHLTIGAENLQKFYGLVADCLKDNSLIDASNVKKKLPYEMDRFNPFSDQQEPTPTPAQAAQPVVNEAHVTQLVEMGFDRESALNALQQSGRNVIRAAEYLLTHPPIVGVAPQPQTQAAPEEEILEDAMNTDAVTDDGDENFENMDEDSVSEEDEDDEDADMQLTNELNKKEHPADKKSRVDAEAKQEQLVNLRRKFGDLISLLGNELISASANALQELKDIYINLSVAQPELGKSLNNIEFIKSSVLDSDAQAQQLAQYLNFYALLFKDDTLGKQIETNEFVEASLARLVDILTMPYQCSASSYLLVVENLMLILEQAFVKRCQVTEDLPPQDYPEFSVKTVEACVKFLSMKDILNAQAVNCAVRLLSVATRSQVGALRLVELDAIPKMFAAVQEITFAGQSSLFMVIFRHVFESDQVLRFQIQSQLSNWFTTPRSKAVEVSTMLKNFAGAVVRNQKVFVEAVTEICRLTSHNKYSQIALLGKDAKKSDEEPEEHLALLKSNNLQVQAILMESQSVKQVIYLLMDRLLEYRVAKDAPGVNDAYHICFTLQSLAELFSSYHPAKLIALSYSKSKSGKDKVGSYKGFKSFLLFLLTDMLPYQNLKTFDTQGMTPQERNQVDQTNWVLHMFSVLCQADISEESTAQERRLSLSANQTVDYMTVRKITVDMTVRSIKEAMQSGQPSEQKYGRLYALSVLIVKMLGQQQPQSPAVVASQYQQSLTCRAMMEKNVVQLLTSLLNDIDPNYPGITVLVNSVLKALEQLTRQANKLSKSSSLANSPKQSKSNLLEHVTAASVQNPLHLSEDFIRDSALGMFGSGGDVRHSSDSSDDSDSDVDMMEEDQDDYESGDEDAQDDFTDISDESMPEDEDMDSNVDMEVVIRTAPVDGMDYSSDGDSSSSQSQEHSDTSFSDDEEGNNAWMDEGPAEGEIGDDQEEEIVVQDENEAMARFADMFPDTEDEEHEVDEEDQEEFDEGDPYDNEFDMDGPEDFEFIGNPWGNNNRRHRRNNIPDYIRFAGQHEFGDLNEIDLQITGPGGVRQHLTFPEVGRMFRHDNAGGRLALNDDIGQNPLIQRGAQDNQRNRRLPGGSLMNTDTRNALQFLEQMLNVDGGHAIAPQQEGSTNSPDTTTVDTSCHPVRTTERWLQEGRALFGSQQVNQQATRVSSQITEQLMPYAKEAEDKRNEAIAKQKEERLAKMKKEAEEKRLKAEQQPTSTATAMEVDQGSSSSISGNQITIHGTQVDLANTGIDIDFLQALPDDVRLEVVAMHMRDEANNGTFSVPQNVTNEFIDALPEDLRQYVEDRQTEHFSNDPFGHEESGPEQEFISTLPPNMRQFFRQAAGTRQGSETPKTTKKLPNSPYKEPVQLVDHGSVVTLLQLVYSQNSGTRDNYLHTLLANLCENGGTRNELLNALLNIVVESARSYSRGKSTPKKSSSLLAITDGLLVGHTQEYRTVTAIERSLSLLSDLIAKNELNAQYFLTDSDSNEPQSPLARRPSGPKKQKSKYPLMSLLQLMEHKMFLSNSSLMELLTAVVASITKLFAQAAIKADALKSGDAGSGSGSGSGEKSDDKPAEDQQPPSSSAASGAATGSLLQPPTSQSTGQDQPATPTRHHQLVF